MGLGSLVHAMARFGATLGAYTPTREGFAKLFMHFHK